MGSLATPWTLRGRHLSISMGIALAFEHRFTFKREVLLRPFCSTHSPKLPNVEKPQVLLTKEDKRALGRWDTDADWYLVQCCVYMVLIFSGRKFLT